jgi:protein gp37
MAGTTAIEWTDATWNPVTGCTQVSPGCDHCYAMTFAERWRGIPGHHYEQGFDLRLWESRLTLPLRWKSPRRIFVNSMSDLFHADIPEAFIRDVFATMQKADWHIYQILTKRPQRLARMAGTLPWPEHIWAGVSVESNEYAWRADFLRHVPAAVRFISAEPLLGPVDQLNLDGIHWVITGGESGAGFRPCSPTWVRGARDRCIESGVAYFHKQWGGRTPKAGGRLLDGRTWDEFPNAEEFMTCQPSRQPKKQETPILKRLELGHV